MNQRETVLTFLVAGLIAAIVCMVGYAVPVLDALIGWYFGFYYTFGDMACKNHSGQSAHGFLGINSGDFVFNANFTCC